MNTFPTMVQTALLLIHLKPDLTEHMTDQCNTERKILYSMSSYLTD